MSIVELMAHSKDELKQDYPIHKIGIFGSFARGDETSTSDVDVLVEFFEPVDIFSFIGLKQRLEALLEREVDLVTVNALKPQLKERILNEVVYV